MATPGDPDVQHPALLLQVVAQTVRHHPGLHAEDHDPIPLAALHPVHGRERDPVRILLAGEAVAEPGLEPGRIGVQVGHGQQTLEVVEVAGALPPAGAVEQTHGRPEADVVAHDLQDVSGGAPVRGVDHRLEVLGQAQHLGRLLLGHLLGDPSHARHRPRGPAVEPVREPLGQAAGGAAHDLDDVAGVELPGAGRREAQVGQRRPHAGALEHLGPQHRAQRDAGLGQRDLRREQERVHPGQDGHVGRSDALGVEPVLHHRHQRVGGVVGAVVDDPQAALDRVGIRSGVDRLLNPPTVVGEEVLGPVDDLDRAAVVDGERVGGGAGEELVVVDEEPGVGGLVAVDDLVVVADAEHVARRQGQEPDEQDVGRGEVLELVDQQVPAALLHRPAERTVGEQHLDGPVDLLVEVDRAPVGQGPAVGVEQVGQPVDVVARRLDLGRFAQAEPDRAERFQVGADRVGVGPALASTGQQRLDEAAAVALLGHRRRPAPVFAQHPVPERVQGPDPG